MALTRAFKSLTGLQKPTPMRVFGAAAACALVATLVRLALEPFLPGAFTFITFFPAVVLAALSAGSRAGWLTVGLSLAVAWAVVPPRFSLGGGDAAGDLAVGLVFTLSAGFIASLAGAFRQATIRLEDGRKAEMEALKAAGSDAMRLSAAQKAGGIGIMDWDVASGEIYWSDEFRRNWGFEPDVTPSYALMLERVHPEDRHVIEQSKDRAWGEGALYDAVYRVPQADGSTKWLAGRGEVIFDDAGKPVRMVGINRDVTAQKQAEQALRESEARFRLMADTAPAPVWMTSAEGGVEFINEAFREFLGQQVDLALGQGWLGLMHPDDRPEVERKREEARKDFSPYVFEARFKGADEAWRWVQAHSKPRFDDQGRFAGYIGIAFDITQTREAEAALRESEERFRAMADVAPVFLWGVDADGAGLFVNQAFRSFFGFGDEGSLSQAWREGIHPDDRDAMVAAHRRALEAREPYETLGRFRRADGEWRWFLSRGVPRFDASGTFLGVYGASIDVTEAREAQAALAVQERRQRFLLELGDAMRATDDPRVISDLAVRAVGERLDVARVGYGEIDAAGTTVSVNGGYTNGAVETLSGQFRLDDFGPPLIADLKRGVTVAVPDVGSDARTSPHEVVAAFAAIQTRSVLCTPLLRGGRLRAFLYLHHPDAKAWTEEDVSLVEEVAERTWAEIERARAEAALRESEQRFRLIADSAPVPMWVTRADGGGREFVNQAYVEFLGVPYEEALSFDWRRILHPDDAPRIYAESQAGEASGRPFTLEARYRRADGEQRWLQSRSQPRLGPNGEPQGFIGVAFDVTEARRAEAVLRESEERFRLMADSAPVLLSINEPDGTKTFVNRAYVEFWGAPEENILGRGWREAVHPDDLPALEAAWTEAMRTRAPFQTHARFRRGDGQWRWLRKDGRVRLGPDGEPLGYLAVSVDVTEAMQVQENLERINDLLSERVAAALAEKEQAEAALLRAQKLEAVGRLTGGVAHDFNNLLTVVVGALDMIIKHPDDVRKRTRMAEAAMAAARRGERLTHQLLAFSRRQALRPEVCDLNALIRESEPLLRRGVGEGVSFEVRLSEGPAVVKIDPGQFDAALLNLLVNARDATPDGGTVTVETGWREFAEGESPETAAGRYVRIAVRDTGAGMTPEVLARVFEPFFTTKPVGKGTGLGLSQVYGFARQSGGTVTVDSELGRGTEIALYLPASAARVEPQGLRFKPADRAAPVALRVLLVEDDPSVGAIAEAMLRDMGHHVMRAENAEQAMRLLRHDPLIDVLLTDVIMPGGVNGVELARQAVAMKPRLDVLLMSGYAGETVDQALSEAPWPFLRKPYSAEDLAELMQNFSPKSAQRTETEPAE